MTIECRQRDLTDSMFLSSGEVVVQRTNWEKLWTHSPSVENSKVRGLDWRPDERILAIGYSSGLVELLDVENEEEIHSFKLESDITCLSWTQNMKEVQDELEEFQDGRLVSA